MAASRRREPPLRRGPSPPDHGRVRRRRCARRRSARSLLRSTVSSACSTLPARCGVPAWPTLELRPVVGQVDSQPPPRLRSGRPRPSGMLPECVAIPLRRRPAPARGASLLGLGVTMLLAADLGSDGFSSLVNGLEHQQRPCRSSSRTWPLNLAFLAMAAARHALSGHRHAGADRGRRLHRRPAAYRARHPGPPSVGQALLLTAAFPGSRSASAG